MLSGSGDTPNVIYAARMPRPRFHLIIVVLLSACFQQSGEPTTGAAEGGSSGSVPSTTTTLGRLGIEQATLEFGSCMRAEGTDTPDIRLDAQGRPVLDDLRAVVDTTSDEFRRALTECAPILTRVGALDLRRDPELQVVILSQLRAFAECVRSEGIEAFPDPDPAFSGVGSPFPSDDVPFTDPSFEAAIATCREALGSDAFSDQ
jgi:hypothetical protein